MLTKHTQTRSNHMSSQIWTLQSNNFIPQEIFYSIPSRLPNLINSNEFRANSDEIRYENKKLLQINNKIYKTEPSTNKRKIKKQFNQQTKIERRVNPLLLPLRILINLLRILTLPLRILLAPLIILLRAILRLLARFIGLLLFFINPFFFLFVGFQIFNIARIVGLILRIIFMRIFRRRAHEKREEKNVKVITLKEEEGEHSIHHTIRPFKEASKEHDRRRKDNLKVESTNMSTISQLLDEYGNFIDFKILPPDYASFTTNKFIKYPYYQSPNLFNQQFSQESNFLTN